MPLFTSENQPMRRGRPKGSLNTATLLQKLIDKKITDENGKKLTRRVKMLLKQIEQAEAGNVKSFNAVFDRLDGKPKQEIESQEHKTVIIESAGARPEAGTIAHELGTNESTPLDEEYE